MKHLIVWFATALFVASCSSPKLNQFTPGEVWKDNNGVHINAHGGGILFMNDTYYWYGEHKTEGEKGNVANVGVHCYSSKDLYNWKDEGVALAVSEDASSLITKGCILERPKVIYNKKNNNYVMWFHLEPKGVGYKGAFSGVAVADSPTGEFRFIDAARTNKGHWPINATEELKNAPIACEGMTFTGGSLPAPADSLNLLKRDIQGGQMARDMNLFVDDDGKAYHIYSSEENSTLHIALLNDDYTAHSGVYSRNFVGRFMEAPALFKRNSKYYLIMSGCTGWAPNQARSAVADNILGPWRELGDPCINDSDKTTFSSQSTFVLNIAGTDKYIYMGDRWTPSNAIDGRYIWLPIQFEGEKPTLRWQDAWAY